MKGGLRLLHSTLAHWVDWSISMIKQSTFTDFESAVNDWSNCTRRVPTLFKDHTFWHLNQQAEAAIRPEDSSELLIQTTVLWRMQIISTPLETFTGKSAAAAKYLNTRRWFITHRMHRLGLKGDEEQTSSGSKINRNKSEAKGRLWGLKDEEMGGGE